MKFPEEAIVAALLIFGLLFIVAFWKQKPRAECVKSHLETQPHMGHSHEYMVCDEWCDGTQEYKEPK